MDIFVHELRKIRMNRDFKIMSDKRRYFIGWVDWLDDDKMSASELKLLLRLSNLSATDGFCYASNEYLSEKMGCTTVSISRYIKRLIDLNYISAKYEKEGALVKRRIIYIKHSTINTDVKPRLTKMLNTINTDVKENNTSINITSINKKTSKKGESFEQFWNTYGKKVDKKKAREQWMKLSEDDIRQLFYKLEGWLKSHPELKYRPHPMRWLRDRRWEDEIEQSKTSNSIKYL